MLFVALGLFFLRLLFNAELALTLCNIIIFILCLKPTKIGYDIGIYNE